MKRIAEESARRTWPRLAGHWWLAAIGLALGVTAAVHAEPASPSLDPTSNPVTSTAVQYLAIFAALVMILLVQIVALIIVFRRYAGRLVPQVRVEVVQDPAAGAAREVTVHRVEVATATAQSRRRAAAPDDLPELPPEYAEEVRAKMDAKQRQDEGVLRQIVADNLKMRKQIESMDRFEE
jgi:hypothetical protein